MIWKTRNTARIAEWNI